MDQRLSSKQKLSVKQKWRLIPFVGIALLMIGFAIVSLAAPSIAQSTSPPPAVEWLKFQVPSAQQSQFIQQDAAIWTPVLASYPGFRSKEIWVNPTSPDELILVIHWDSFDQWQAIPKDVLDRTTQEFYQAMSAEYLPEVIGFNLVWNSETDLEP